MANTLRQDIVSAIIGALSQIRVSNGYETNVATAAGGGGAQKVLPFANGESLRPFLVVSIDEEQKDDRANSYIEPTATGTVACRPADDGTSSPDDLTEQLLGDVEKCLLAQRFADPILGLSYVVDFYVDGHQKYAPTEKNALGAELRFRVRYRHALTSPRLPPS